MKPSRIDKSNNNSKHRLSVPRIPLFLQTYPCFSSGKLTSMTSAVDGFSGLFKFIPSPTRDNPRPGRWRMSSSPKFRVSFGRKEETRKEESSKIIFYARTCYNPNGKFNTNGVIIRNRGSDLRPRCHQLNVPWNASNEMRHCGISKSLGSASNFANLYLSRATVLAFCCIINGAVRNCRKINHRN